MMKINLYPLGMLCILLVLGCTNTHKKDTTSLHTVTVETPVDKENQLFIPTKEFSDYWYSGEAEIASYKLEQARYGEMREGTAALIFVTEDFLPNEQVKADQPNKSNISVLKLNQTKNFNTGIYPYSIMQSTFFPVNNDQHALKVSCSVQEWCGQVYTQLNNRSKFDIKSHSYFQSEADQEFSLSKDLLENELWTQLRINPKSLPTGNFKMIPSLEFIRLKHVELKAYSASATLKDGVYLLEYPELNRSLKISFNNNFPFDIIDWEETFESGFGSNAQLMTTTATRMKLIKSAYWTQNRTQNNGLRAKLKLNCI